MNSDLPCNTVKDLLPIYFDGIASEETNIYVKKHLSQCNSCQSEYKKLYEIEEKNEQRIESEADSIKILKKKLITWFITVIVLGILLTGIAMFSSSYKSVRSYSILEAISVLPIYAGIYFLPLLGTFVAILWKKTIPKKENAFWPNVIISFLVIWITFEILFLLWRFFLIIRVFL
ncbi:zf-HC2 domain-containing protein [Clostridium sp. MSJ-11]|uniref:Zf-HC2 domain-containing protein n=1 Tax=Clostridium mobile TaxID=2841512 RepID=A0ABS6EF38_9CLOT|nr:zf-HC2 domain-containing protein [Clostridium mobile]MBU5483326.1 zf-HC2 domain-containing protein [Clostridium mobile]